MMVVSNAAGNSKTLPINTDVNTARNIFAQIIDCRITITALVIHKLLHTSIGYLFLEKKGRLEVNNLIISN